MVELAFADEAAVGRETIYPSLLEELIQGGFCRFFGKWFKDDFALLSLPDTEDRSIAFLPSLAERRASTPFAEFFLLDLH